MAAQTAAEQKAAQAELYFKVRFDMTAAREENAFPESDLITLHNFYRNELSLHEAAQQITQNVSRSQGADELYSSTFWLFHLLNNAAIKLCWFQPQIIELLDAIQKLPDLELPPESLCVGFEQGDIFKKLPNWGDEWADTFSC